MKYEYDKLAFLSYSYVMLFSFLLILAPFLANKTKMKNFLKHLLVFFFSFSIEILIKSLSKVVLDYVIPGVAA